MTGKGRYSSKQYGWAYEGTFNGDYPNGVGKLDQKRQVDQNNQFLSNGHVYEGEFKFGSMHGQGKMTEKTINTLYEYEGSFVNNTKQGKGSLKTMTISKSTMYAGDFSGGR